MSRWKQRGSGASPIKTYLIMLLVVYLTAAVSFANVHGVSSRQLAALSKIQGSLTFAVLGDTRSGDKVYHDLAARLMEYKPAFVVNTGDMVFMPDRGLWASFWEQSKPITVPYFLTMGNHDSSDLDDDALYKEEVKLPGNKLYYSFTAGDSLFIVLDSEIPDQDRKITGEQYAWLKKTLSTSDKKHKFVFVHHPLYSEKDRGRHYMACLDKYQQYRDRLAELLKKNKVDIVFAGHEHLYLRKTIDGLTQIITGGGGAPLYTSAESGGFYHFILVTVSGHEVKGEVINIEGRVKDTFQLKKE
jgi:predicted phosphodiesterase